VEAGVGLGERRELAAVPVEAPAVDEQPADDHAVPDRNLVAEWYTRSAP
jgi:hypothetical protein